MTKFNDNSTAVLASTTLLAVIFGGIFIWKEKRKSNNSYENITGNELFTVPIKWKRIGEVDKILTYPLKAARHLSLKKAKCTKLGLVQENPKGIELLDRSFIVYDDSNERVTSNKYPKILFVQISVRDTDRVVFSCPGAEDLVITLPLRHEKEKEAFVIMYSKEKLSTFDCGDDAALWFSKNILNEDRGFRLGYHRNAEVEHRTVTGFWESFSKIYTRMRDHYFGAYAYLSSYLIMTSSSLDDLNQRLAEPVTDYHFRPNLVIKGTQPYEEDTWDWLKIGETAVFHGFKPCTRCVITTINPETGVKHPDQEPLKTLRTYRQLQDPEARKLESNSPVLGIYAGLEIPGNIHVGDPVYVKDI